jgi:hypothetical protein
LEELTESMIDDCVALSRSTLSVSCDFEADHADGRSRLAIRLSGAPPWRIGVLLPARLRTANAAPTNILPYTKTNRKEKA